MSAKVTVAFALLSGLLLIVAGVTVPLWTAPPGAEPSASLSQLAGQESSNLLYVFAVSLSSMLFAPVVVALSAGLHRRGGSAGLGAGTLFLFGLVLEVIATLGSLARWTSAIPSALSGDLFGQALYQTLTIQYMAVDFAGVALIYFTAVWWAFALRKTDPLTALLLAGSVILLIIAFGVSSVSPSWNIFLLSASIIVYGAAYIGLGGVAVRLQGPPLEKTVVRSQ